MPTKITATIELILGALTFISTIISGNYVLDFVVGVATYFGARILYRLFGKKILDFVIRIKQKYKK